MASSVLAGSAAVASAWLAAPPQQQQQQQHHHHHHSEQWQQQQLLQPPPQARLDAYSKVLSIFMQGPLDLVRRHRSCRFCCCPLSLAARLPTCLRTPLSITKGPTLC